MGHGIGRWRGRALVTSLVVLCGCGEAAPARTTAQAIDDGVDACMTAAGVSDPMEGFFRRYEQDPDYKRLYEECLRSVAPEQADELLTGDLSPARRRAAVNEHMTTYLACAIERGGWQLDVASLPLTPDGLIDQQAILTSLPTDQDALRFLQDVAACGGGAAPDVAPEDFHLERGHG